MSFTFINPEALGAPHGYSNGVLTEAGGRLLFVAGQIAWDKNQKITSDDLVEQFDRALANVIAASHVASHVAIGRYINMRQWRLFSAIRVIVSLGQRSNQAHIDGDQNQSGQICDPQHKSRRRFSNFQERASLRCSATDNF